MTEEFIKKSKQEYEQYIKTAAWQQKRLERLEIDNYTCQMCGSKGTSFNPLQIHHLVYHNIYKENVEKDLVCLCQSCHMNVHHMMNRITDAKRQTHGWKDKLSFSTVVYDKNRQQLAEQIKE